jgi:acetyl esterase/lipase
VTATRIDYGPDSLQHATFTRATTGAIAAGTLGTVVLIHGGFWRAGLGLDRLHPAGEALRALGWNTYDVEYRTVGWGGGWPQTLDDIAASIDALAAFRDEQNVDLGAVTVMGHSAGGQLAIWAAARFSAADSPIAIAGAISLAGVVSLARASDDQVGESAATEFLGGTPSQVPERYAEADPIGLPSRAAGVRVRSFHGRADVTVPPSLSEDFTAAAVAGGWDATLTEVDGDHFQIVLPDQPSWPLITAAVSELSRETR